MKNVLAILIALVLSTSFASAATTNNSLTNLKNAVKQDVTNAKNAIKKDVDNAKAEQKASKEASNKEKKAALKEKRDAQVSEIDKQISTKKSQIKEVKKSTSMTETEKTIRVRSYERQIETLEAKKAKINEIYEKSAAAIK